MAGKIIVDTLDTDNSFITLNVQQATVATMNANGIFSRTGTKMIGTDGSIGNSSISGATVSGNLNFDATGTTGIRLPAANTLSFHTTGTEDVRIDSAGNVGIGTTSPSNRLSVVTASGSDGFISVTSPTTETAGVLVNGGTSSNKGAIVRFQKNASTKWTMGTDSAIIGGTSDNFHLYGGGTDSILFSTNAAERMRIDSSGRLLVGLTSWAGGATNAGVAIKATSTSSSIFAFYVDNSSSNIFNIRCDGSTYNTTGVWGTISDQRLKENIVDAAPKLDNLLQLKVRNFNFTGDENKTKQIGFVAQEIEQVFPSLVSEDAEGTKAVKTTVLLPMLVKAIQEQQAIIDDLKARIEALEA